MAIKVDERRKEELLESAEVGIIFALTKEHAAAVRIFADDDEIERVVLHDGTSIDFVNIQSEEFNGSLCVALMIQGVAGNTRSAYYATRLYQYLKSLEIVILCGIAGGAPKPGDSERDIYLGDVLVVNHTGIYEYDYGKEYFDEDKLEGRFDKTENPNRPSEKLQRIVRCLESEQSRGSKPWLDYFNKRLKELNDPTKFNKPSEVPRYRGTTLDNSSNHYRSENLISRPCQREPQFFVGCIGSGNRVLKNPIKRDHLRDKQGIYGFEMEGAGLAEAAAQLSIEYYVVRGICDYCDDKKNNSWHDYAAAIAAAFLYTLLRQYQPDRSVVTPDGTPGEDLASQLSRHASNPSGGTAGYTSKGQSFGSRSEGTENLATAYDEAGRPVEETTGDVPEQDLVKFNRQIAEFSRLMQRQEFEQAIRIGRTIQDLCQRSGLLVTHDESARSLQRMVILLVDYAKRVSPNTASRLNQLARDLVDIARVKLRE